MKPGWLINTPFKKKSQYRKNRSIKNLVKSSHSSMKNSNNIRRQSGQLLCVKLNVYFSKNLFRLGKIGSIKIFLNVLHFITLA